MRGEIIQLIQPQKNIEGDRIQEADELTHGDFNLSSSTFNRTKKVGKKILSISSDSSNTNFIDSPPELDQK